MEFNKEHEVILLQVLLFLIRTYCDPKCMPLNHYDFMTKIMNLTY